MRSSVAVLTAGFGVLLPLLALLVVGAVLFAGGALGPAPLCVGRL